MEDLPTELVKIIFTDLPVRDKCTVMMISKRFNKDQHLRKTIGKMKSVHINIQKQRFHKLQYILLTATCYPDPTTRAKVKKLNQSSRRTTILPLMLRGACRESQRKQFYRKTEINEDEIVTVKDAPRWVNVYGRDRYGYVDGQNAYAHLID